MKERSWGRHHGIAGFFDTTLSGEIDTTIVVMEFAQEMRGDAKKLPSSAEEGWLRDQAKREATFERADGVVLARIS